MKVERVLDGSRTLQACGFLEPNEEEGKISSPVLHFLQQRLPESMLEFKIRLETAAEILRNLPLRKYRKPQAFEAAWQLVNMPPPLADWDFLFHIDPEKTGVLCGNPGASQILLVQEDLDLLYDANRGVSELWCALAQWRKAVCCVWASTIVHELIYLTGKKGALLSPGKPICFSEKRKHCNDEPLGVSLDLSDISDAEADEFHVLGEKAMFGSADCEYSVAEGFKGWLRSANISILQRCGLNFQEAHLILLAATQHSPYVDIELGWDREAGFYRFTCIVKNHDAHGYVDPKNTAYIPTEIVFSFFEDAAPNVREDMLRLVIRAGRTRARDLLLKGLEHPLD